jgi:hypothetical protein
MKNKTCMICKTTVKIPGDKYVHVAEHDEEDKQLSKGWYHSKCFRDRLNGTQVQNAVQIKALDILDKIGVRLN